MRTLAKQGWVAALALPWLAGCQPPLHMPVSYYRAEPPPPALALTFRPQRDTPPAEAGQLRALAARLPERAQVVLYAAGPLATARLWAVERVMERPVALRAPPPSPPLPPGLAVLVVQGPGGIVPDACRGPGAQGTEDNWPGDDGSRGLLLPPGCAVAASLQAQVTSQSDLLVGRPLPPGAATPFAAAIERYYRRNDPGAAGSQPGVSRELEPSQAPSGGQEAAGRQEAGGNPLLGGLPPPRQEQAGLAQGAPDQRP